MDGTLTTTVKRNQEEEATLSHDEAFEVRRRHVAITDTGKSVHESCCGCVDFYQGSR